MNAVIKTGGKQYRVKPGDIVDVELLKQEAGARIAFNEVLFVSNGSDTFIGAPVLTNYVVWGELIETSYGDKITSVKYQPGNHYKKFGHRQKYSRVKITEIAHKEKGGKHGS